MGRGWSDKGGLRENRILYPSRKTSTTQASTPRALHAGQNWLRQPPMLGEGTSSYFRKPPFFWGDQKVSFSAESVLKVGVKPESVVG